MLASGDDLNMIAYVLLFGSAFVAATILPLQSEAVLVALLAAGDYPVSALIIVATVGNVLGSVINWFSEDICCASDRDGGFRLQAIDSSEHRTGIGVMVDGRFWAVGCLWSAIR